MKKFAEIIATFFYVGKVKYAPGTFGSLPAFLISYIVMYCTMNSEFVIEFGEFNFYENQILTVLLMEVLTLVALFIGGTFCTKIYIEDKDNQDPKEVVIDEVVGQMLSIILCFFSSMLLYFSPLSDVIPFPYFDAIFICILPFILFRLFDILKPWPIDWVDSKVKGALGVMLDDVVAGLFAATVHYVLALIILDYYQSYLG